MDKEISSMVLPLFGVSVVKSILLLLELWWDGKVEAVGLSWQINEWLYKFNTKSYLTLLSHLNPSYNNFSGRILSGYQLNILDYTSYLGNPGLCGAPLNEYGSNKTIFSIISACAGGVNLKSLGCTSALPLGLSLDFGWSGVY